MLVTVVALLMLQVSCDNDDPISSRTMVGSGVPAVEVRTVAVFDEIVLETVGEVTITQGSPQSVSVTVDDNIMPYLQTVVSGGRLTIRMQPGTAARDFDLTVEIVVSNVNFLSLVGVGSFMATNELEGQTLELDLSGVGSFLLTVDVDRLTSVFSGVGSYHLAGAAAHHSYTMSGVGDLLALGLVTDTSSIVLSGQGSGWVHAIDQLNVTITGTGSIHYRGHPDINAVITGTGQLIDTN
jgi:hypothetical protein